MWNYPKAKAEFSLSTRSIGLITMRVRLFKSELFVDGDAESSGID